MKVSTKSLQFINEHNHSAGDPAPNGVDDLVEKIGARLGAIEDVIEFGKRFAGVTLVKIVSCEDHPQADRLHVCKIDDGGIAPNVERDDRGLVQVVCGAPNVRAGMLAAWIPPGATVPNTYDTQEPFVLQARALRGVVSNGMLASPKELSLGDSHEGLLEITLESDEHIEPGTLFVDAYHLRDDVVIDMENKMFTHRPDCFGWLGVARELEGIQHRPYKSPEWYRIDAELPAIEADELPFEVHNELPALVPRFTAIVLRDVTIGPSPVWLQVDLARVGSRPINNIVDFTNFYMHLTGQPIHAYDYDKVKALSGGDKAVLTIRFPKPGEKITLLTGKEIEPRAEAMMVAAGDHLVCVGGAMGGADTEVDENTKHIIIEAANWDMYSMRRTAMEHGIFTDAVTRFTKGQSPLQNRAVVAKIVDKIRRSAGGSVASPLIDINHVSAEVLERGSMHPAVTVSTQFINDRLGWQLSAEDMSRLLTNVEFGVDIHDDELIVTAPFWRTDIEIPEDVVEEVGRLNGYDQLPLQLPKHDLTPAPQDGTLTLKSRLRALLAAAGANEVLSYTFVHGDLLAKVGQLAAAAYQLSNALSPDLQYYRLSITPGLLERARANIKAGYDQFALFEMGKVHMIGVDNEEGLPRELDRVAVVCTTDKKNEQSGAAYYQARTYLMHVLRAFGLNDRVTFEPLEATDSDVATPYYQPGRAATVRLDGVIIGRIGEYKPSVRRALKLPEHTAGFELGLAAFMHGAPHIEYQALPRFPKVEQDICLKVPADTSYADVYRLVADQVQAQRPDNTRYTLEPLDIYQRADDQAHKQITLRLRIASFERTLTDAEVARLLDDVAAAASQHLGAERV
jgi:phenylalanyl-tRNA synthetase beta chain